MIFFTQKIATTVSSVQLAKLTQFLVIVTTKGVKRPEKLKKGQKDLNFFHIRPLFWPSKIFWPFFNFSGRLILFVVVVSEN